jgi:hypothetical protein
VLVTRKLQVQQRSVWHLTAVVVVQTSKFVALVITQSKTFLGAIIIPSEHVAVEDTIRPVNSSLRILCPSPYKVLLEGYFGTIVIIHQGWLVATDCQLVTVFGMLASLRPASPESPSLREISVGNLIYSGIGESRKSRERRRPGQQVADGFHGRG